MAKRLLLVRHCSTGLVNKGRFIGSSDVKVDTDALHATAPLAQLVASYSPDHFYCSPLNRTRQTAEKLNEHLGLDIEIEEKLQEIDFGRWEKLSFEEIAAQDPVRVHQWSKGQSDFTFPGGDQIGDFHKRVHYITQNLIRLPGDTVLVVTHGGVIRTIICQLLGLEPNNYLLLFDIKPSTLAMLDIFENRGVLTGLNLALRENL